MNKNLQLHIPEPCHEAWNNMNPEKGGRFCASCQKTVVDFTSMTDQAVLQYFKNLKGNTCGRFRDDQLNRELQAQRRKKFKWYKYIIQLLFPTLVITSKSFSQGEISKKPAVCIAPTKQGEAVPIRLGGVRPNVNETAINGKVVDKDGAPISFATVIIKGTKNGAATDKDGKFKIKPSSPLPLTLSISSLGYEKEEIIVDENRRVSSVKICLMEQSLVGTVGAVVVGRPARTADSKLFHKLKRIVVDTLKTSTMKIFPNPLPVSSVLTIEYPVKKSGEYIIKISDLNGKLLYIEQVNVQSSVLKKQISIKQELITGSYIVSLFNQESTRVASAKLIVQ